MSFVVVVVAVSVCLFDYLSLYVFCSPSYSQFKSLKNQKKSDCNHLFFFRVRLTVEGKKKRTKIEEKRCPKLNNNSNKIANKQPMKKATPERKKTAVSVFPRYEN